MRSRTGCPICLARKGLLALTLILNLVASGAFSAPAEEATSHLVAARWQGNLLNWARSGAACWLQDEAGNLRLEILSGPGGLDDLLDWDGPRGWTLIATAAGQGTLSRWQEEWEPLEGILAVWARFLVAALDPAAVSALPDGVRERAPARALLAGRGPFAAIPAVRTFLVPVTAEAPTLRARMQSRGLGRGGTEAVVRLSMAGPGGEQRRLTSSRHPGSLVVDGLESFPVTFQPASAFLPWWPLRSLLIFP